MAQRKTELSDVFYLILRRMRFPLLLIIGVYTFCTAGLVMIPGTDPATGQATSPVTVFDAFYIVSYTSTTIGFGEVPVPYNAAQRMWMTLTIYISVAAWSYSLVSVLTLLQDKGFQNAVRIARFTKLVNRIRLPFYIVCGIGETGRMVCHGLDHLGLRFVVLEVSDDRLQELRMDEFTVDPPAVHADAKDSILLRQAGLLNPNCRGVVALTDDDQTNQAIAVNVRLLAPRVPVLARIRDIETETHIGVFGGDLVINPFEQFADSLAAAITTPERYRLRNLVTGLPGAAIVGVSTPPKGHWILCGYGRFGRMMGESLQAAGMSLMVIDELHYGEEGVDIKGTGTRSEDLKNAGIEDAVGLVAGNSSDAKNLSIAVTARAMKHDLYVVVRQNQLRNTPLFDAFDEDLLMVPSQIVAREFLARITTPLLNRFLRLIRQYSESECAALYGRLALLAPGRHPEVWDFTISASRAPELTNLISAGGRFTVGHLRADPFDRGRRLSMVVLLVRRKNTTIQLPDDGFVLCAGDVLLIAGSPEAKRDVELVLTSPSILRYIVTGDQATGGALWCWLTRNHPRPIVPLLGDAEAGSEEPQEKTGEVSQDDVQNPDLKVQVNSEAKAKSEGGNKSVDRMESEQTSDPESEPTPEG